MADNPFSLAFNTGLQRIDALAVEQAQLQQQFAKAVFVDLSKDTNKANIVRGGFGVAEAKVIPDALQRWLGGIDTQRPRETPRVVGQSLQPGKKVPTGTAIDLVLAPSRDIPLNIFEGTHGDLRDRSIGLFLAQTLDQEAHKEVLKIVLAKETEEELDDSEKAAVESMLEAADIEIDDSDAEKSFRAAYRTLRYSSAYR